MTQDGTKRIAHLAALALPKLEGASDKSSQCEPLHQVTGEGIPQQRWDLNPQSCKAAVLGVCAPA